MLTALVFNIFPTLLEVSMVTGILVSNLGDREHLIYILGQNFTPLKE